MKIDPLVAIILAAGTGNRLRPYTETRPKAMIDVAGAPIISWQLGALGRLDVECSIVCVGHEAETVDHHVRALTEAAATPMPVMAVVNERFAETGTAYSLLRALAVVPPGAPGILVLEGDILVEVSLLADLVRSGRNAPGPGAVIVAEPTSADSSDVYVRPGGVVTRVVHASRRSRLAVDARAERWSNMGCYLFTGSSARHLAVEVCEKSVLADPTAPLETAIDLVAVRGGLRLCAGDLDRAREIDTPADLEDAAAWWTDRARTAPCAITPVSG